MNKVKQILAAKGHQVWRVSKELSVLEALKIMSEKRISSVMVVDGDQITGIFTERDFAQKVGLQDVLPSSIKVGEVMSSELITVEPDTSVNQCMAIMTNSRIRHLPVMENGNLIGIISIGDIVKDVIEELQFMVTQLENYVINFR
ncbi:MAG: CBS domain-containing protein [Anaerolineales bacterium]|nr:CBS domain-containing protein [Anaerolineales bacterium]